MNAGAVVSNVKKTSFMTTVTITGLGPAATIVPTIATAGPLPVTVYEKHRDAPTKEELVILRFIVVVWSCLDIATMVDVALLALPLLPLAADGVIQMS